MTVTTRFAPSPTGMLHIGGARTALFNHLLARHHGGRFLLRIEDTDKARSTPEATEAILEAMAWLGLDPDDPPVFQSERADRHVEVAHTLIEKGAAFRCYATPEDLQARRDAGEAKRAAAKDEDLSDAARAGLRAEADGLLAPFRSPWRDGSPPPSPDAPYTVRLRAPDKGTQVLDDAVQGRIEIQSSELDDLILLRADGSPTYMLAVVVDDHDMGITHVVRGDDHLRNAFRQRPVIEGMGWPVPLYAHVPMIHGQDGAKLSKRHGALSTLAYRDMGYLPEAMRAYLLRLGWSQGDKEIFTDKEAMAAFSLDGINKAPARLDLEKLDAVNAQFLRSCEDDRLLALLRGFWETETPLTDDQLMAIRRSLPQMKDRGATLPALAEAFDFITQSRPFSLNKKARKALKGDGLRHLAAMRTLLAETEPFDAGQISQSIDDYCAAQGITMGAVGPALRAAATGGNPAPDLNLVLDWLGKDEVLSRLDEQLAADKAAENKT
ncbi:MAG: glutamate--tRNA ligase family protein [Pseudomonadota bacterium]